MWFAVLVGWPFSGLVWLSITCMLNKRDKVAYTFVLQ